ncbi:MAG: tRNA (guanosine(46)-N7)-methyltransferase TrmB [Magnetococcales bacterium]|nr:tRNA (guanosine(46)-N7)-methyltransferase TrmB [Magnetococcales bacterium]MBF0114482.1 tRNA (guanosine(46)-N7)-methyltransferase TrmB [Magnetococcales bacterium]
MSQFQFDHFFGPLNAEQKAFLLADSILIPRGRKVGKLGPHATVRLQEMLPGLAIPQAEDRGALLQQLGADPRHARLVLEVGFGNGEALAQRALRHPQDRFIGVEVFSGGVAALLLRVQQMQLTNLRIATQSIHEVLLQTIPLLSLDQVLIHFPDPWPKRGHHKRRLLQKPFLDLLAARMRPQAQLSLATDWPHYAEWMRALLAEHPAFARCVGDDCYDAEPEDWLETRFQRKARNEGRPTFHLTALRRDGAIYPP